MIQVSTRTTPLDVVIQDGKAHGFDSAHYRIIRQFHLQQMRARNERFRQESEDCDEALTRIATSIWSLGKAAVQ